uniref:Uncharacterized protein n=1 Tax=Tanacetum cinerariifolium TaxID=118510 RepID=A0A6L2MR85_TANCI|nr:hypothetical protein [Tanacetum cinerariifolium]
MPPALDLSYTSLDEFVNKPEVENYKAKSSKEEPKFWSTAMAKTINEKAQLHARVDGKKIIITEASIRRDLQLADVEGVDCLPNSTIFKQLALMGKPTRKVIQSSDPMKHVADEVVHKKLGDSLVRAATTASSLGAEQDSSNINKTQSKATPNESSSQSIDSGGGPRCQEAMRDTTAQTRVLELEKTKTSQHNEIASLKIKVKKLEKRNRSRTHKLKILYKVSLTVRVESSDVEESLGEDASKQGRIKAIDADEDITLVNVRDDIEMFHVNDLDGKELFVAEPKVVKDVNENVVEEVVNVNHNSIATTTITTKEHTLAQALEALKTLKPKMKGIVIQEQEYPEPVKPKMKDQIRLDEEAAKRLQVQEQEELSDGEKTTLFQQIFEKGRKNFAAKRAEEKRNKPPPQAQKRKIIAFKRVNTFEDIRTELVKEKEKRARKELIQESTKKQKVEDEKETTKLKKLMEIIPDKEEVAIYVIPLAVKSPRIVD